MTTKNILAIGSSFLMTLLFYSNIYAIGINGDLSVEILSPYNLVEDSNRGYQPESFYAGVRVCNLSTTTTMTNVHVNIGNYDDATYTTVPVVGDFPDKTHAGLTGLLSLELSDCDQGVRILPELAPGECNVQYWLIRYPKTDDSGDPVYGACAKEADDLSLELDAWATVDGVTADDTWTVWPRCEISAMANKIWPNGDNKVPDAYVQAMSDQGIYLGWDLNTATPVGDPYLQEGVWFDLGNINQGFDNNGDFVPDYNVFMCPVGDPYNFDPCCFRLVRTYGLVIVKKTDGTEALYPFENQMYFTDLPSNNRGAVGLVFYEWVAIGGGCTSSISPYQEVASGRNNEKFNGDYGTFIGLNGSEITGLSFNKTGQSTLTSLPDQIDYSLSFTNSTGNSFGAFDQNLPTNIQDEIPEGTTYVAGSAAATNSFAGLSHTIMYSTDNGLSWSETEPSASSVTNIMWQFNEDIPNSTTVTATFSVNVPLTYPNDYGSVVENVGGVSVGLTEPFLESTQNTFLPGTNTIGSQVWFDDGAGGGSIADGTQDGAEAGIPTVDVNLYYDFNNNGVLDDDDILYSTQTTIADGSYSFTNVPDGLFFVIVDESDIPIGNVPTTPTSYTAFVQLSDYLIANFGFTEVIEVTKNLISESPAYENHYVTYEIAVENLLPTPPGAGNPYEGGLIIPAPRTRGASYGAEFNNDDNIIGEADNVFATQIDPWRASGGMSSNDVLFDSFDPPTPSCGDISSVKLLYTFCLSGPISNDEIRFYNDGTILETMTGAAGDVHVGTTNCATHEIDITASYRTWESFVTNPIHAGLIGIRDGNAASWDGATLSVDAISLQIETINPNETNCSNYNASTCDYIPYTIDTPSTWSSPPDDGTTTTTLPFDFNFGGTLYPIGTSMTITSNGQMCFTAPGGNGYPLVNLPNASYDNCIHIWADLNPSTSPGAITYGTSGVAPNRLFILDFTDIYYFGTTTPLSLQIVLHEASGEVQIMVNEIDETLAHTLGISYSGGALLEYNNIVPGGTINNVCYSYEWISVNSGFNPETTLSPVPLTDNFDPCYLEFLEASIEPDLVDNITGLITWNDVGHINAGNTQTVEVTFVAKDPNACATANPTDNLGTVSGATFADGDIANDDSDIASVFINPTGSIGDFIWNDLNGNGIQDVGENGLEGVMVTLVSTVDLWIEGILYTAGSLIITVTDENGFYEFDGLLDATYTITVDPSTIPGTVSQTGDPDEVGTVCSTCDNLTTVIIAGANDNTSADFGYDVNNAIAGTIWEDNNADGVQGDGENILSGVTVNLLDCGADGICGNGDDGPTVSTITDINGYYEFVDLSDGNYGIEVDNLTAPLGTNWTNTLDPEGTISPDNVSNTINLSGGNIISGTDFAYHESGLSNIGDQLFYDWNGDGIHDVLTEEGMSGVVVNLYEDVNGDGIIDPLVDALVTTDVTDINGTYLFENLPAGDYLIEVDESTVLNGSNLTADPDEFGVACIICDGTSMVNVDGTLVGSNLDQDYGYEPIGSATIGDYVWHDMNGDGEISIGETGLEGIVVELYADMNGDGTYVLVATTTTDASGNYEFTGLPDGDYQVSLDLTTVPVDSGANPYQSTTASTFDVTVTNGQTDNTTLSCTDCPNSSDFGLAPFANIGDVLFWDANNNGTQDWTEEGIADVTVFLHDCGADAICGNGDDGPSLSTTTDANGNYLFSALEPSNYVVEVDITDLDLGGAVQTADPNSDGLTCDEVSDPDPTINLGYSLCDAQMTTYVGYGANFMGADFGFMPSGVMGDMVWYDVNGDGIQDPDEPGLGGIVVELQDGVCTSGLDCPTIETDIDGNYIFTNVPDGNYTIVITDPSGTFSPSDDRDLVDDNTTTATMSGGVLTSVGGNACTDCDLTVDFGLTIVGTNSIAGNVCLEDSGSTNGACGDGTDSPLAGETVYLYNDEGTYLGSTTILPDGSYSFSDLPDDIYYISIASNSSPLNLATTTDPANITETGSSFYQSVDLSTGGSVTGIDFPFVINVDLDFGDLPLSYSITTLSDGPIGAYHIIPNILSPDLYLGATVDAETDGLHTDTADGDDATSGDEDGVSFGDFVANWSVGTVDSGNGGSVTITLTGSGWLLGYIDWNQDGDFMDAGELVIDADTDLTTARMGAFTFDIPAGTNLEGNFYTRFRLMPEAPAFSIFAYSGEASNGEVEDYRITFPTLPVELIDFTVEDVDCNNVLKWSTASEENSSHFIVEHSTDGKNYNAIGRVEAAGNSLEIIEYEFRHEDIDKAYNYYRLKQIDFDGAYEYFDVVFVKNACYEFEDVSAFVYPNPTPRDVNIEISSTSEQEVTIQIVDALGRLVQQEKIQVNEGTSFKTYDLKRYENGYYNIMIITDSGTVKTYKIIKVSH